MFTMYSFPEEGTGRPLREALVKEGTELPNESNRFFIFTDEFMKAFFKNRFLQLNRGRKLFRQCDMFFCTDI